MHLLIGFFLEGPSSNLSGSRVNGLLAAFFIKVLAFLHGFEGILGFYILVLSIPWAVDYTLRTLY